MGHNTNNSKVSIFMLICLIIIFLAPPITALVTLLIKYINQKNKIKNSRETRILSLNNIKSPISINEIVNYEKLGNFIFMSHDELKKKYIKYDSSIFFNIKCEKEYFFIDDKLDICNYQLNKSCNPSVPKHIFRELKKINGNPDEIYFDKDLFLLQCIWYGKNGHIVYKRYISNMVEITFKLDKRAGD